MPIAIYIICISYNYNLFYMEFKKVLQKDFVRDHIKNYSNYFMRCQIVLRKRNILWG